MIFLLLTSDELVSGNILTESAGCATNWLPVGFSVRNRLLWNNFIVLKYTTDILSLVDDNIRFRPKYLIDLGGKNM